MRLELKDVTKTYGSVTALDHFSMVFEKGVYGILGANGAGKSTMINLITDNVKRDAGERGGQILYDGEDVLKLGSRFRGIVGYMPQEQGYYDDFSAEVFLRYMAELKGIPKRKAREQIRELLEVVHLSEKAETKVGGFSGGMKQRILLAQALLGEPEILILDEPTAGLDPKERINIRNYIAELAKDRIILFATHVVSDIECISDQVMLLRQGKLLMVDTPQKLIESIRGKVAEVVCTPQEAQTLRGKYKVGAIRQRSDGLILRIVGEELPPEFPRVDHDINLEDVYLYYLE